MWRVPRILASLALAAGLGLATGACTSWQHLETHERWTLYGKPGDTLDAAKLERALEPAFRAVEAQLGPFKARVRIHAWTAQEGREDAPTLPSEGAARVEDVPGIGKARVRAYHVTGGPALFSPSGVFLGTSEVGTVVHELVHARLAELGTRVPLWFEEGLASLWGDGACYDGEWYVDGLACWPARVLRDEPMSDAELARVLALTAHEEYSSRDNLLVHFVGWALVFDLARELPDANHTQWLAHFKAAAGKHGLLPEARRRIAASIGSETIEAWLEKLTDPDPGVRLAAAKGMWKLRSQKAVDALIAAVPKETDPQVQLALGLNALLAVGEMRVSRRTWRELWRKVVPALGEIDLEDHEERPALREFLRGMRGRGGNTQSGLDGLARFWEE
jgi:hypothetical protein